MPGKITFGAFDQGQIPRIACFNAATTGVLKRQLRVIGAACVTLALTACADLTAVQKLATAGEKAGESLAPIAADIAGSCERTRSYEPRDIAEKRNCDSEKSLEKPLLAVGRVLEKYLQALGSLAGGKTGVYDASLGGIAGGLEASGKFDKGRVAAVGGIVKFMSDAATDAARRRTLSDAVRSQNANVQSIIAALQSIVGTDYLLDLQNEELALSSFSETLLREHGKTEPLAAVVAGAEWQRAHESLKTRRDAANAYGRALAKLSQAHQRLADGSENLGAKELMSRILSDAEEIESLREKVVKAF